MSLFPKLLDLLFKSEYGLRLLLRLNNSIIVRADRAQKQIIEKISPNQRVLNGPFKGLIYPADTIRTSALIPKFLGSYEKELHACVEKCFQKDYSLIINIGAGEGYYAAGAAMRLPKAHVLAFEADPDHARLCSRTVEANAASDRVTIRGACSKDDLKALTPPGRSLILCDCEGMEYTLLDPDNLRNGTFDILVETHDTTPGLVQNAQLLNRFRDSHHITIFTGEERDPREYPELACFSAGEKWLALSEFRPFAMTWFYLEAK